MIRFQFSSLAYLARCLPLCKSSASGVYAKLISHEDTFRITTHSASALLSLFKIAILQFKSSFLAAFSAPITWRPYISPEPLAYNTIERLQRRYSCAQKLREELQCFFGEVESRPKISRSQDHYFFKFIGLVCYLDQSI